MHFRIKVGGDFSKSKQSQNKKTLGAASWSFKERVALREKNKNRPGTEPLQITPYVAPLHQAEKTETRLLSFSRGYLFIDRNFQKEKKTDSI